MVKNYFTNYMFSDKGRAIALSVTCSQCDKNLAIFSPDLNNLLQFYALTLDSIKLLCLAKTFFLKVEKHIIYMMYLINYFRIYALNNKRQIYNN